MYLPRPCVAGEPVRQWQREMLAQAEQQRLRRQLVAPASVARRAERAGRRMRRAVRRTLQLRAELEP